jgi:flagellar L-ring protein precursor FlgH
MKTQSRSIIREIARKEKAMITGFNAELKGTKIPMRSVAHINLCLMILSVTVFMSGCSRNLYNLHGTMPLDTPPVQKQTAPIGSLWAGENSINSMFTDKKARYLNDIVTITISETSMGANTAKTTTSRDSSATAGIAGITQASPDHRILAEYQLGGSSSNSMKGDGQTSRNSSLSGTMTARVVRILANGNLFIEGRRQVTVNAEDQYLVLTGVIRPEDISSENTIASYYVADAKIYYAGKGVIDDKQRPGWLTRVVDWVWPF